MSKSRKDRDDQTVDAHEKKHELPKGTLRNPDGSKIRANTKLRTLRKRRKEA